MLQPSRPHSSLGYRIWRWQVPLHLEAPFGIGVIAIICSNGFLLFLRLIARAGWVQTIILTLIAAGILMLLSSALNLVLPAGILQEMFYDQLFWPLV